MLVIKKSLLIICAFFLFSSFSESSLQKTYVLIPKKNEKPDIHVIKNLPPNLQGMAALYSAMGGSNCIDQECMLTSALGLGKQGSDAQKSLIEKYFPNDKVAKLVLSQDCYLSPGSASTFSNFASLSFIVRGDSVLVNYKLNVFEHGQVKVINGPDIYTYKNHIFKNCSRVLYAWTNK
jgi:hypothetical protein